MKLPYGLADFETIVRQDYVYVDRTAHIQEVEKLGAALLFIRPRRFGKSLWLQTLKAYYDLRRQDEHERLFGHLAIGREPTPLAHRYFVLEWDFSAIAPYGGVDQIERRLEDYVLGTVEAFAADYAEHLPRPVKVTGDPVRTLTSLLTAIRQTPYRLYLLIDEYDNFANEVMVADGDSYGRLLHAAGPYKSLFKWVKSAMAGQGLERLFVTGVSPMVMSDLTSAINITKNLSLHPQLADLCGFREAEVLDLVDRLMPELEANDGQPSGITAAGALEMMRTWYNGYLFSPDTSELVYNPTLVLYCLNSIQERGQYPGQMADANLAADEDKLRYLGQVTRGRKLVADVLGSDRPLEISRLEERFTLANLLERETQDERFLGSFLYYFGMLTLAGETPRRKLKLSPPNLVTKALYVEALKRYLGPAPLDGGRPAGTLTGDGEIAPFLRFVEARVFPVLSNRDYLGMGEKAVKILFLTLLFDDVSYTIHSEPELERRYADLCLLRRPDARAADLFDLLFELKYVGLKELKMTAQQVRELERDELARLPAVAGLLDDAEGQLRAYARALESRLGAALRLRAFAVVAVGFERLVAREFGGGEPHRSE